MIFINSINSIYQIAKFAINTTNNIMNIGNRVIEGSNHLLQGVDSFTQNTSKIAEKLISSTTQVAHVVINNPIKTTLIVAAIACGSYQLYTHLKPRITLHQTILPRPDITPIPQLINIPPPNLQPPPQNIFNNVPPVPINTYQTLNLKQPNNYIVINRINHINPYYYILRERYISYQQIMQNPPVLTQNQINIIRIKSQMTVAVQTVLHIPTLLRVFRELQPQLLSLYRSCSIKTDDHHRLSRQELSYYKGRFLLPTIITHLSMYDEFQGNGIDSNSYANEIYCCFCTAYGLPLPALNIYEEMTEIDQEEAYDTLIKNKFIYDFSIFNQELSIQYENDSMAKLLFPLATVGNGLVKLN